MRFGRAGGVVLVAIVLCACTPKDAPVPRSAAEAAGCGTLDVALLGADRNVVLWLSGGSVGPARDSAQSLKDVSDEQVNVVTSTEYRAVVDEVQRYAGDLLAALDSANQHADIYAQSTSVENFVASSCELLGGG